MNDNLGASLSIDDIASEFLVGSANLKRIFKKETGQSIIHYFHVLKMEAAQTLIIKNEKSYTEIASLLGFNSVHHFSTAYKYTGLPALKILSDHNDEVSIPYNTIPMAPAAMNARLTPITFLRFAISFLSASVMRTTGYLLLPIR